MTAKAIIAVGAYGLHDQASMAKGPAGAALATMESGLAHDRPQAPTAKSLDMQGFQKTAAQKLGVVCGTRNPETTWRGAATAQKPCP